MGSKFIWLAIKLPHTTTLQQYDLNPLSHKALGFHSIPTLTITDISPMVHKVILLRLHPVSLMQKMIDKFDDFLVEYPVCAISVAVV